MLLIRAFILSFFSKAKIPLKPGALCSIYLLQLERIGLKVGTWWHTFAKTLLVHSRTNQYFEEIYARTQKSHAKGHDFISALALEMKLPLIPKHFDQNFPKQGPLVVQSNHPFGVADALVLYEYAARNRPPGDVYGLATDTILEFVPEFSKQIIPVDIYSSGTNSKVAALAGNLLKDEKVILLFPRGHVSRRKNIFHRSTLDRDWRHGGTLLAVRNKAQVLQIHIEGTNTRWTDVVLWICEQSKLLAKKKWAMRLNWSTWLKTLSERGSLATIPWENFLRAKKNFSVSVGEAFSYQELINHNPHDTVAQTEYSYRRYLELRKRHLIDSAHSRKP